MTCCGKGTNRNKTLFQNAVKCIFYFGCLVILLHHYKLQTFSHILLKERKKGGKNVVNLVLLTKKPKNAFNLPHIVENNVK